MPCRRATLLAVVAAFGTTASAEAAVPAYVLDAGVPEVYRVDTTTGARTVVRSGTNRLTTPTGIALEADGDILVSDTGTSGGSVVRIDGTTGVHTVLSADTGFGDPSGVAVEPDGDILVTDSGAGGLLGLPLFTSGAIHRLAPGSGMATTLASDGSLVDPVGIAVDSSGSAVVADTGVDGVLSVASGGSQSTVTQNGPLSNPQDVAVHPGGDLLVASATTVVRIAGGAATAITSGTPLQAPSGIELESPASALVTDRTSGTIVRVALADGEQTVVPGAAFSQPVGIALPADGDWDGAADTSDNCADVANALQTDTDGDSSGDACDADDDGDGLSDVAESTLGTSATNPDSDADTFADAADLCPTLSSADNSDTDGDGTGDPCDLDDDDDGLTDALELSLGTNPLVDDSDGDAVADGADNCPAAFNPTQPDADQDGLGNHCDATPSGEQGGEGGASPTKPAGRPGPKAEQAPAPDDAFEPAVAAPGQLVAIPAAKPVIGRAVAATAQTGAVTVRRPGGKRDVPLPANGRIPVGATVDATRGAIVLTSALPGGRVQSARFTGGRFTVTQRRKDGITDLRLVGGPPSCATARAAQTGKSAKRRRGSRLWGDGHGRFRTHGRNAVASVRGTKWLVEETCRGTLVKVARGVVSVRDVRTGRSKLVRKGEQLLTKKR